MSSESPTSPFPIPPRGMPPVPEPDGFVSLAKGTAAPLPEPSSRVPLLRPSGTPGPAVPSRVGEGAMVLGWADLTTPEVDARVEQMRQAQLVPLVRSVGAPVQEAPPKWYWDHVVQMTSAGLAGGLAAWVFIELFLRPDSSPDTGDSQWPNISFVLVLAAGIGVCMALWDPVVTRDWRRLARSAAIAVPVMLATGALGGLAAGTLYRSMTRSLVEGLIEKWSQLEASSELTEEQLMDGFLADVRNGLHMPRGLAWMIAGVAVGIGVGAASRSPRRLLNTTLGGAVGGFLGGFVFDYFDSGPSARAMGIGLMGVLIGLAMGLVESVRKSMWLSIRSGGMAGKQFILYRDDVVLGSAPDSDITLVKDPGVAGHHARISRRGGRVDVASLDPQHPVVVDGVPVAATQIRDGSTMQLGATLLAFHEKGGSPIPTTGPVRVP